MQQLCYRRLKACGYEGIFRNSNASIPFYKNKTRVIARVFV
jgi:hypothetical protein